MYFHQVKAGRVQKKFIKLHCLSISSATLFIYLFVYDFFGTKYCKTKIKILCLLWIADYTKYIV